MIINEYKNQVQVLLRFLSDIDKGNCLPCETDQKLITQYIHHLSTNFNTQKAFSYMKRLLSEKMQAPEFKELFRGNDGKTYRKLRFDFENGDKFSSYPSRTTVIKICFDFNIRDKNAIDKLFDNLYFNRLYLKDKKDCVYFYFLTMTEKTYREANEWLETYILNEDGHSDVQDTAKKYTAELYDDINEIGRDNLEGLKKYISDNAAMFESRKYYQFTAKGYIRNAISQSVDNPVTLQCVLFDIWADIIDQGEDKELNCTSEVLELRNNILKTFGNIKANNKYDLTELIPTYCKSRNFLDEKYWSNLKQLYLKVNKSTISRGSYLLLLLAKINYDECFTDDAEPFDIIYIKLNNALEIAGFAPLNYGGLALDTVVCDFIDAYFEISASVVGYEDEQKTITEFVCRFIDSLTEGKLDFCFE